MKKREAVIFDLDGTLALVDHRRHLVTGENKNWKEFYQQCEHDTPNFPIVEICKQLRKKYDILILSGRSNEVITKTNKWLSDNNIHHEILIMRHSHDDTPDEDLKKMWYEDAITPTWDVVAVFDDRQKVVDMWRDLGLTCCQVAPGNF